MMTKMKVREAKTISNGAVFGAYEVRIETTKEETDELRNALKVLDRWKKAARQAVKHNEKDADFTMYKFAVKSDCAIVTIEMGACG